MQWYHHALILLAVTGGYLAWHVPRAVRWLTLGALSFATSAMWHNYGLPYPIIYGATTNFMICICLSFYERPKWENGVFNSFILMILIDALFACGFIKTRFNFAVTLEVINATAILIIWSAGIMNRIAKYGRDFYVRYGWILNPCHQALFAKEPQNSQWRGRH